ncbi:methyltransferase domain-containing protein [Paraburkholderia acidisoli]|uniref:Methyltransferase domain-containing protein n=1 Tax=Paraburkholderia acidisoli TaxID=2571748 RepID=A0A7Z2GFF7_9BURK|nr:methyltransferase domain-containing protein [Paraburkholderia acidisoli]QGZ60807.1 methyltransferase domain-containing protein [Paraburkholderia acidisoli]
MMGVTFLGMRCKMDRRDQILKYIGKEQLGIEIGPYCWPLTPKRDGYRCLVMDVFDTATTRARAAENPTFTAEVLAGIEDIDLVGSSTLIDDVIEREGRLGEFDYIVSSHNFEHLPNPLRFLQGCARVLKPEGIISMAIPDRRACYDYFRPVTRLADWLDAWLTDRHRPTYAQSFDERWVRASYDHHGVPYGSFFQGADPALITAAMTFEEDFAMWRDRLKANDAEYHDAHCSVFTPASLELLLRDSAWLGLIPFEVVEIYHSPGVDIFVHLRRLRSVEDARPADYPAIRERLLHRVLEEAAQTSKIGHLLGGLDQQQVERMVQAGRDAGSADADALAQLQRESNELRAQVSALQAQLGETERAASYARSERLALQREVAESREKERHLNASIADLRESTSWRITAPIRKVKQALSKKAPMN